MKALDLVIYMDKKERKLVAMIAKPDIKNKSKEPGGGIAGAIVGVPQRLLKQHGW